MHGTSSDKLPAYPSLCTQVLNVQTMEMNAIDEGEKSFLFPCDSPQLPSSGKAEMDFPQQHKSSKIFVGGLNPCTSDDDLAAYFGQFGTIVSSKVIFSRDTGNSRRFGFAVFENSHVANAVCHMQNHEILG